MSQSALESTEPYVVMESTSLEYPIVAPNVLAVRLNAFKCSAPDCCGKVYSISLNHNIFWPECRWVKPVALSYVRMRSRKYRRERYFRIKY